MNLTPLVVDAGEAEAKADEYAHAADPTPEDRALATAYRAAAAGLPLVRLSEVIAAGGTFDNGLPRLAIVRADARECFVATRGWTPNRRIVFADNELSLRNWRGARRGLHTVAVPRPESWVHSPSGRTVAPLVPPGLRPRRPHRRHVLWEVEAWAEVAPVDPALLRHLLGDLWVVEAVWELTELERAVLGGAGELT